VVALKKRSGAKRVETATAGKAPIPHGPVTIQPEAPYRRACAASR
jgi:hypothetical protein